LIGNSVAGAPAFETEIAEEVASLSGAWREPRQMLAEQSYGEHASIHDDETAKSLGFQGGTIEGPTHFSQFAPLGYALWGERWIEQGCLSAHYKAACYEGEKVRAHIARPESGARIAAVWMEKEDGTEVLRGTASVGPNHPRSELDNRLAALSVLEQPVILSQVQIGARTPRQRVRMGFDQNMGHFYPFTLSEKLRKITEPSTWYTAAGAPGSPFGRPVIPMEMISVLVSHATQEGEFYTKGPVVGLFADQEIKLLDGPLFVDEDYEVDREAVALSGSRRTESLWVLTRVYRPGADQVIATMLLNGAVLKDSYAAYAEDRQGLYGQV
jgi:hypothetical protein